MAKIVEYVNKNNNWEWEIVGVGRGYGVNRYCTKHNEYYQEEVFMSLVQARDYLRKRRNQYKRIEHNGKYREPNKTDARR